MEEHLCCIQSFPDINTATVKNLDCCRFIHVKISMGYIFNIGLVGQRENAFWKHVFDVELPQNNRKWGHWGWVELCRQAWIWPEFHHSLGMWLWASHLASQGASVTSLQKLETGLSLNWVIINSDEIMDGNFQHCPPLSYCDC